MPNIIGDIAGNYNTLMALLKQMPDEEVISVGDMIDRGPHSKQVLEWFMKNGTAVLGNHEHLLYTSQTDSYMADIFLRNGGIATIQSFFPEADVNRLNGKHYMYGWLQDETNPTQDPWPTKTEYFKYCLSFIPEDIFKWIQSLSIYFSRT